MRVASAGVSAGDGPWAWFVCRLLLLKDWLDGGGLSLAAPPEARLEALPGLGPPGDLVSSSPILLPPCFGWRDAPVVGCLWVSCLEDLTGFFQVLVPLVLWRPSPAVSSSLRNPSGLARVFALALVVDRRSRSSF